jgi:hypothetical protein
MTNPHAGDAAAWPVEAGDQSGSYRIGASDEDDWRRGACDLARCRRRQTIGDDHGDLAANQIGRQLRQPVEGIVRPPILDRDVLALDKAGFGKSTAERCREMLRAGSRRAPEKADHRHRRLLRVRRDRPRRRRTAEKGDELAPPHGAPTQFEDLEG